MLTGTDAASVIVTSKSCSIDISMLGSIVTLNQLVISILTHCRRDRVCALFTLALVQKGLFHLTVIEILGLTQANNLELYTGSTLLGLA